MGKERVRCFVPEGSQKRKATRVRSLRQRWIVNSVVPIFVLLALIVGGVSLGISNYYYKGMLDGLERQARAQSGAFVDYFMDQGFANYLQRANQAISDYADKERVEMQFLSSVGRIQASSTSNLTVGTRPGTEDISRAVETNRISYFRGADPKTGEQILAVSHGERQGGRRPAIRHLPAAGQRSGADDGAGSGAGGFTVSSVGVKLKPDFHQQCGGAGGGGI